jgi:hypothetical protein
VVGEESRGLNGHIVWTGAEGGERGNGGEDGVDGITAGVGEGRLGVFATGKKVVAVWI